MYRYIDGIILIYTDNSNTFSFLVNNLTNLELAENLLFNNTINLLFRLKNYKITLNDNKSFSN